MNFKLLLLTFCLLSAGSFAQTPDANAIIDKTAQKYAEWGGIEARFTAHIRWEKNGVSESFEGTIRMKENKFTLATPDMMVWFDGVTQWTYSPRNEEVNINTPSGDDLLFLNPMLLLHNFDKDFNAALAGESTSSNAKPAYDVALTPKHRKEIEKIELQIEKRSSLPVRLVASMRNLQRITVVIHEMKAATPSGEVFTFPAASYPQAELIDLR